MSTPDVKDDNAVNDDLPLVTAYTDGGASPNPGLGGWGAVLVFEKDAAQHEKELSGSATDTTNNRMELTAALEALKALKRPCHVAFYTDSQYLKRGINQWLEGWKATNFKKGKIQNADLWLALDEQVSRHQITWHWVKGHSGNRYNERVDQLATSARESLENTLANVTEGESTAAVSANNAYLSVSCLGAPGAGAWAVLLDVAGEQRILSGHHPRTNAARLDLLAAIAALEALPAGAALQVFTGNSYLRDGITQWVSGWKKSGWKKKTGGEVVYRDLWEKLDGLAHERAVKWTLTKADARPEAMKVLEAPLRQEIENAKRGQ